MSDVVAILAIAVLGLLVFLVMLALRIAMIVIYCVAGLAVMAALVLSGGWALGVSAISGPLMFWLYGAAAMSLVILIKVYRGALANVPALAAEWYEYRRNAKVLKRIGGIRLVSHQSRD